MKIRTGFVSNSSSSSFVIFGCMVEPDDMINFKSDKVEEEDDDDEDYDSSYRFEPLIEKLDENHIAYNFGLENYGDSTLFIGMNPDNLQDDKTLKQSKEELAVKLKEITGFDITAENIGFYSDGGMDY